MSKGYILVDVPENCRCIRGDEKWCQFGGMVCLVSGRDVMKHISAGTKPDWCPIRELPERRKETLIPVSERVFKRCSEYATGWNDCLKTIIGNQEERDNAKEI